MKTKQATKQARARNAAPIDRSAKEVPFIICLRGYGHNGKMIRRVRSIEAKDEAVALDTIAPLLAKDFKTVTIMQATPRRH